MMENMSVVPGVISGREGDMVAKGIYNMLEQFLCNYGKGNTNPYVC